MIKYEWLLAIFVLILATSIGPAKTSTDRKSIEQKFSELSELNWKQEFFDSCTEDWRKQWFLDGERAIVRNSPQGMLFSAGPVETDHASHAVIWTKKSFVGDVKIEFDYTRMDTINRNVNILYIQATGIGKEPYDKDIAKWSYLRVIPYMKSYFQNMNLLHISFAAYDRDDLKRDYVRARRYPVKPDLKFDEIAIPPDNFDTGLFEPGIVHHFTVIKKGHDLYMKVAPLPSSLPLRLPPRLLGEDKSGRAAGEGSKGARLFYWDTSRFQPVTEGRIGLRHMWTRCSRYKNVRISTLALTQDNGGRI